MSKNFKFLISIFNFSFFIFNFLLVFLFSLLIFNLLPSEANAAISKPPSNLGLVGYWSFNEGKGVTSTDYSGNKNNGTLTSFQGNPWVNGKLGKALSFDGSNDYVDVGSPSSLRPPLPVSISAWIYPKSSTFGNVFQSGRDASGNVHTGYLFQANGTLSTGYGDNTACGPTGRRTGSGATTVPLNKWSHVVAVIQGATNMQIYINGVADTVTYTGSGGSMVYGSGNAEVGRVFQCGPIGNLMFSGLIDEVRIYNRALSASEVAGIYQSGAVKFNAPDNKGLVGYWSFNEGQGVTSTDYSGNKNNGTLTGMQGNPWVNGKQGYALSFDGSDDYVSIKDNETLDLPVSHTLSVWIKPNVATGERLILSKLLCGSEFASYSLKIGANDGGGSADKINYTIRNSNNANPNFTVTQTGSPTAGVWTHIVGTHDGTTMRLYINGALDNTASGNSSAPYNGTTVLQIGSDSDCASGRRYQFNGGIDEVRIYNRALTPSEVEGLYKSGAVKFKTPDNKGLVGYWSFNEGKGVTSTDYSGNKNNGTLTGFQGNPWVNGKLGKALSFDGNDDRVQSPETSFITVQNQVHSAFAWVYPRQTGATYGIWQFGQFDDNNWSTGLGLAITSGQVTWLSNGEGIQRVDSGLTIGLNQWSFIGFVRMSNSIQFFANGSTATVSDSSANSIGSIDRHLIGATVRGGVLRTFFPGLIDEVRIYNRALTASEVLNLYNAGK